jgi:sulfur carrier protein ThiS
MRKGQNISKEQIIKLDDCQHRVIIPLYIPNEEDYYKEAFKIFEMCLLSVTKTAKSPIKVSVVSNGSCKSVNTRLQGLLNKGYINELIIETESIGKINSILKALRTAEERLITITDGDVLFLNDWEKEVLNIFKTFPKAGMVSPVPVFRTHLRLTSNIWKRYLFSKKLQFRPVKNQEAMTRFANSIGWSRLDLKFKDVIATIKANNNTIAVLGNAHFVGTYKREVFNTLPKKGSKYKLGGDSEHIYMDSPVVKYGGYRLATYNNYAYHIGNTSEDWVEEAFNSLKEEQKTYSTFKDLKELKSKRFNYILSEKIFKKLFTVKPIKKLIFKQKGLTKTQLEHFIN